MKTKAKKDLICEVDTTATKVAEAISRSLRDTELSTTLKMTAAIAGFCKFIHILSLCSDNSLDTFCEKAVYGIQRYAEIGEDERIEIVHRAVSEIEDKEEN